MRLQAWCFLYDDMDSATGVVLDLVNFKDSGDWYRCLCSYEFHRCEFIATALEFDNLLCWESEDVEPSTVDILPSEEESASLDA